MSYRYIPYIATEIYLLVYTATILFRRNLNLGSEYEVRELKYIIYSFFVVLVTDIFWALTEGNMIEPPKVLNALINGISISAVLAGCYYWYKFVEYRLASKYANEKKLNILMSIPALVTVGLNLISVFTGWVFYIDANDHYTYGPLFILQSVVCYFYLLIPTVKSLSRSLKTNSKIQRREYLIYASYMVAPLMAGILEDVMPEVPILYLNMFMVIHVLFLTIQDTQIYNDALTGLNNRRRLDQFLEERLPEASPEQPILVCMMDINKFKLINDTYGHVEGDNALRLVSAVLRMIAAEFHAFVSRYGGDEFCLVIHKGKHDEKKVASRIQELLDEMQQKSEEPKPYHISLSVGSVVCKVPEKEINSVIGRADANLYREKRRKKNE